MRACGNTECDAVLADDAVICNRCGWEPPKKQKATDRHPVHGYRLCEHQDRGQRCGGPGTFSSNLREGGPWYCFDHFPPFLNWAHANKHAVPPPMGFEGLRAILNRVKT